MATLTSGSPAAKSLEGAYRAFVAQRMPLFAAGWLALGFLWRIVEFAESHLPAHIAAVSWLTQALVLSAATWICRDDPTAARVSWVALTACLVLAGETATVQAVVGSSAEFVWLALVALCLVSSMVFAWDRRQALLLVAGSLVAWFVALPFVGALRPAVERIMEVGIGALLSLAVAEVYARSCRASWRVAESERAAVRALETSHAAYRDLAENAADLIYTHDLAGRLTYVNEAFARFADRPAAALIGRSAFDLIDHHRPNPELSALIARVAAGESVPPQLLAVTTRTPRWLECVISGIRGPDDTVVGVRGIARDVTERKEAEDALRVSLEELRRSEERLRRLARHQAAIREEERKRLGFDLHDDVCQELVGIGIMAESLRSEIGAKSGWRLDRIIACLNDVGEHLRLLARDLRPMLLRELGLEEGLRSLASSMSSDTTPVVASFAIPVPRFDEETEIGLYRIAQEALVNAVRHAGAHRISVTLTADTRIVCLHVEDDGCGFIPEQCRRSEALGLISMEERALALGARFEVRSTPGRGTAVRVECPIASRAPATAA